MISASNVDKRARCPRLPAVLYIAFKQWFECRIQRYLFNFPKDKPALRWHVVLFLLVCK